MSFLKLKDLTNVENKNVSEKILSLTKQLVELRIKKVTRQTFKPHEFKHIKRQISQLITLQQVKKST